jgi:hypothetical protein
MPESFLPAPLDEMRRRVARIDAAVRPIVRRSIDMSDPSWLKNLAGAPAAVDEAGVRAEAELCLETLIEWYANSPEEIRNWIRELLAHYSSFAWATALPLRAGDHTSVRKQLIHFSMLDQGLDARDAVLWLDELTSRSGLTEAELHVMRHEAAAMSSTVDRYGFGSTATLLREVHKGV